MAIVTSFWAATAGMADLLVLVADYKGQVNRWSVRHVASPAGREIRENGFGEVIRCVLFPR
jgi:hypothetical protein